MKDVREHSQVPVREDASSLKCTLFVRKCYMKNIKHRSRHIVSGAEVANLSSCCLDFSNLLPIKREGSLSPHGEK